jgi:hypothetical protein
MNSIRQDRFACAGTYSLCTSSETATVGPNPSHDANIFAHLEVPVLTGLAVCHASERGWISTAYATRRNTAEGAHKFQRSIHTNTPLVLAYLPLFDWIKSIHYKSPRPPPLRTTRTMDDIPPFITCGSMRQIADELEFGQRSYKIMENESITTLENLCNKQSQLQKLLDKEKDNRQKRTYEKLIHVCLFRKHMMEVRGETSFELKFSEFDRFVENRKKDVNTTMEGYCFGSGPMPDNQSDEGVDRYIKKLVPKALEKITSPCRENLKSCHFPNEEFAHMLLTCRRNGTKYVVVEGPTQLGKSNVKCLVHAVAGITKIGVVILTKGNRERTELCEKIKHRVFDEHLVVHTGIDMKQIATVMKAGGSVVASQTAGQINQKLIPALQKNQREDPNFNWILVLDEADTMFRSRPDEEATVKVEQAYRDLMKLSPWVGVMITATVVPVVIQLVDKKDLDHRKIVSYSLKPSEDYISFDSFHPLMDLEGNPIYLSGPVRYNRGEGAYIGPVGPIPFTPNEVKLLYDDALSDCNSLTVPNLNSEVHHEILGIPQGVNDYTLKNAYKKLAFKVGRQGKPTIVDPKRLSPSRSS